MIIDVFLKIEVDDVKCTDEELDEFVSSNLFGGLVNTKNPLEDKKVFKKKEMFIRRLRI